MHLKSILASSLGMAAVSNAAAVAPRQEVIDDLLPTPIPVDNSNQRLPIPEEVTWTIDEILRATGNVTVAPPSVGDADAEAAYLEARQIFGGADERFLQTSTAYPFGAMGRVLRTWPGASSWCSGSIVGPRVALMARHCLTSGASYRFQPAYYNGERFPSAGVTHLINIPGNNEDNGGCGWKDDWVLLILDTNLNRGYLGFRYFQDSQSNVLLPWWNYGYPQDKSGNGQLPYASNNFRVWREAGCGSSEGRELRTNADVSPGQSGGPVWLNEADGAYQYGVYVGYAGTSYGLLSHGGSLINAIIRARADFP